MKPLLLALCWIVAAQAVCARKPAVRFDLPYTVENGKYVVTVETSAGPRRFVFDTGASRTTISERLSRELGLSEVDRGLIGDFEGHRQSLAYVQVPYLRLGEAVFTDKRVVVVPDSSYIFRCLGFDGIAGGDLLRDFVVRMPNADSTITLAGDIRLLGEFVRRDAARIHFAGNSPVIAAVLRNGKSRMKTYMKFDTGSAALFDCRYEECLALLEKGILRDVRRTEGHSGNLGWSNRSVVGDAVRGVVPEFVLAGQRLAAVPLEITHGSHSKLGCGLFRWGTVVIDYPGRRFWLLPHAAQPEPPDASVMNVTVALDGGRLVVGQVWDETLGTVIAPGDRIVRLGTVEVERVDPCAFIRGEVRPDKPELTVERKDGTRVRVPVKRME